MWLSGLHIPQSYLTALVQVSRERETERETLRERERGIIIVHPVQVACRKNIWPLDRSTLFTYVTAYSDSEDIEERPETVSSSKCKTMSPAPNYPWSSSSSSSSPGTNFVIKNSVCILIVETFCAGLLCAWSLYRGRTL